MFVATSASVLFAKPLKFMGERKRLATVPLLIPTMLVYLHWAPTAVDTFGRDNVAGAGFLLGILGATDWVDGWLARRFNQTSEFGKMFDQMVVKSGAVVQAGDNVAARQYLHALGKARACLCRSNRIAQNFENIERNRNHRQDKKPH